MKKELKPGDRVAVYGFDHDGNFWLKEKAKILGIGPDLLTTVQFEDTRLPGKYDVHISQCRKLKKKQKRRVWLDLRAVDRATEAGMFPLASTTPRNGWIRFVEEAGGGVSERCLECGAVLPPLNGTEENDFAHFCEHCLWDEDEE